MLSTPQQLRRLDQLSLLLLPLLLGAPSGCRVGHLARRTGRAVRRVVTTASVTTVVTTASVTTASVTTAAVTTASGHAGLRAAAARLLYAAVRSKPRMVAMRSGTARCTRRDRCRSSATSRKYALLNAAGVGSSDARDGAHLMGEAIRGPHQRSSSEVLSSDARDGAYRSSRW